MEERDKEEREIDMPPVWVWNTSMACSKEVFEDGEFKSSQSEFNLERMSLMTCIFREKASNVRENSRPTKTNKTSFPLEFDRFGQPKKDTQRILSDAEFVLVVCLPERDHVKAINNLRIAWHGPMSDKEFVLIQALYRTPNKYNFQMKIVWPHENYFSKEYEAIVVLNLREVCNEQEINDLRMPFAFNATMKSRNIKKDVTKRNKKSSKTVVSQQAHFGYCPNRNERGPFLQDRQTKKKLSDIMINSVNIPESAKLSLCRSEVVLFKIVKRLFEEKLGIGIGEDHKIRLKASLPTLTKRRPLTPAPTSPCCATICPA